MTAGRIIKNFNGYYYVETPDKELVTCKIRVNETGAFSAVTGDMVEFEKNPDGESMIKTILPRRNFMERPAMANLDCIVIAFAAQTRISAVCWQIKCWRLPNVPVLKPFYALIKQTL